MLGRAGTNKLLWRKILDKVDIITAPLTEYVICSIPSTGMSWNKKVPLTTILRQGS